MVFNVPGANSSLNFSGHSDAATLDRMLELPMATSRYSEVTAILLQHHQDFIYFHAPILRLKLTIA